MGAPKAYGRFVNIDPQRGRVSAWQVLRWFMTRRPPAAPGYQLKQRQYPSNVLAPENIRVTFVGHCTLVIEVGGKRILTDPMFADYASPLSRLGPRRYYPPGIPLNEIPTVDIVMVTHNHYDHLDVRAVRELGDQPEYIVPLGLGSWMRKRGVTKVREMDWWDEFEFGEVKITAVPCQHWSRRTLFDTCRSLWCGYVVEYKKLKVLFIGDSGYCNVFGEMAERIGHIHIAALPIGSYEPRHIMHDLHMTPEEAMQAFEDIEATILIPTHYGCFPLSDEDPREPPQRLFDEWRRKGLDLDRLWLLAPGQSRDLEHMIYIPTVTPQTPRVPLEQQIVAGNDFLTEWGIAICPRKGEMVDLEVVGVHAHVFDGDGGRTLKLDHICCSSFGDLTMCGTPHCPLHDPAFLKSYGLHGVRRSDGEQESFFEIDNPPDASWWRDKLRVIRKEE